MRHKQELPLAASLAAVVVRPLQVPVEEREQRRQRLRRGEARPAVPAAAHHGQSEHERYLTEETFKKPVIVTDYPKEIKAFYMRLNEDGKTVRAMDVLAPRIGEIIGGSQREERHDVLLEKIRAKGLHETDYKWYLELRKYGSAPHAGFGLGLERMMMYLTGMKNIRDVIPFPRTPGSAEF